MPKIRHRLIDHPIDPETETLIIGTFNPDAADNTADFYYGRSRNFLWRLLPTAFGEGDLKGKSRTEKLEFIRKFKIGFIDLITEVEVDEPENYNDSYLDNKVTEWRNVIDEIEKLPKLKRVCLTRKSFGDIPNMKEKINDIIVFCKNRKLPFQPLSTPARFYGSGKQNEWSNFLKVDNR